MKKLLLLFLAVMLMALTANAQHDYVDLGLPSGTLWATTNVGADRPEAFGDYFAWGETKTKSYYNEEDYKFFWNEYGDYYCGYPLKYYDVLDGDQHWSDGLTELLPEDDAATANWGEEWQIPSKEQIEELINENYTTAVWTTLNGVSGTEIISKSNGNSVFLPNAGYYFEGSDLRNVGEFGYYWSRSLDLDNEDPYHHLFAHILSCPNPSMEHLWRCAGASVRPVRTIAVSEVYTVFDETTGVLTYYYDELRETRTGIKELYTDNPYVLRFADYYDKVLKAVIDPSMKNAPLTSTEGMFYGGINYESGSGVRYCLSNMTSIEGLENLNTSEVTDMQAMFSFCSSLTSLNLSSFNTENVTEMYDMFLGCQNLETVDVSSFNIKKVINMWSMFYFCSKLKTIYCDDDWSGTTAKSDYMFAGCTSLVGGKGTAYNDAFADKTYARPDGGTASPGYFTTSDNKPIQVYTEFVESTGTLTYYYDTQRDERTGITELYDPIKYPDAVRFKDYYKKVTKVAIDPSMKQATLTSFRNMSYGGYDSETWTSYFLPNVTSIEGLENLNTEIVTDMNSMFIMYTSLEELDLSSFNTSNVTNMNGMFLGCNKLQTLDLTSFDVSKVKDMRMMFGSCYELTTIYCNDDWSQIVPPNNELEDMSNMYVMFSGCKKLVGGQGTAFDSNVINGTYARPDGGTEAPGYFTAGKPTPQGDVNNDGTVDIADVVAVLNAMAGGTAQGNADVNNDGSVDIADVVAVLSIMAKGK